MQIAWALVVEKIWLFITHLLIPISLVSVEAATGLG